MVRTIVVVSLALCAAACSTSFTGDPYFPGGPRVCYEKCAKANMEMGAFIYAGEFATACVCEPHERRGREKSDAEISAIVGVMTERRNTCAAAGGVVGGAAGGAVGGAVCR
jgi:hypothetical protein